MKEKGFVQFTHFGCLVQSVPTLLMPTSIFLNLKMADDVNLLISAQKCGHVCLIMPFAAN